MTKMVRAIVDNEKATITVPHIESRANVRRELSRAIRFMSARAGTHRIEHIVDRTVETLRIIPAAGHARGTAKSFFMKALSLVRPRVPRSRLN